ncbi:MAG: SRPBCC family protein [bacterium]
MITLIRREFVVEAPLETAWRHLAQVERWPTWAKHIKHVELSPAGELTPASRGLFRLSIGIKSEFRMAEMKVPRHWKWSGPFLWLTIHYDHQFEALDHRCAKLIWIVEAEGFGALIFGSVFALVYNRNLDRAIPRLQAEMKLLAR